MGRRSCRLAARLRRSGGVARRASRLWASATSGPASRWPGGGLDAQRSRLASATWRVLGML
eukprot:15388052-Alexandrium_andersonii.AAC.1